MVEPLSRSVMIVIGGVMTRHARATAGTEQAPVLAPLAVLVCSALLVLSQLYLAIPLAPVIAEVLGVAARRQQPLWVPPMRWHTAWDF